MQFRRIYTSLSNPNHNPFLLYQKLTHPLPLFNPQKSPFSTILKKPTKKIPIFSPILVTKRCMAEKTRPTPPPETMGRAELYRALEAAVGSTFSPEPLAPGPNPLIIVISGPSGVGKDAVIKKLREVRENIHFVVTATSRARRPGEVEGKDYYFVSKDEFLAMIDNNELLEYALVYGDYKGIPKKQITEKMALGLDIVLRVDVQGARTLRGILGDSAVFVFLVAESEEALVRRLIDRETESKETLLVRIATAREEVKHMEGFDYVVVNREGELEGSVRLMESIIDAEKARVRQRTLKI